MHRNSAVPGVLVSLQNLRVSSLQFHKDKNPIDRYVLGARRR
jgi:hypothetical protein